MKLRPRRVMLAAALAATAVLLALSASAQANTTLPGNNGKIAYTTNATTQIGFLDSAAARGNNQCFYFPLGFELDLGFDVLDCTAEIATINPDGTGFTQVTNNSFPDDKPAWLPQDGSKLAYQEVTDADCFKGVLCGYNVYDAAPDGSSGHQLTTTHIPGEGLFNSSTASYSPDGSKIAFEALNNVFFTPSTARVDLGEDPFFKQFNHLFQTIYTMPSSGEAGGATPLIPADEYDSPNLISDSQPTYSPDGTKIAFVRMTITPGTPVKTTRGSNGTIQSSIYVVSSAGGTPTQVDSTGPCEADTVIIEALLAQQAQGGALRTGRGLTGPPCTWDAAPAWSPDGRKIAVERITFPSDLIGINRAGQRGLAQIFEDSDIVTFNSADGSGETDLSDVTEPADCATIDSLKSGIACGNDQKPAWSPDGTKIAFFSDRNADGVFPFVECEQEIDPTVCDDEIWTMNADGSSPTQVTNNDVNDINPDWQSIPIPPAPPVVPASPVKPTVGVAGVRRACVSSVFHVRFRISTTASSVKSVVVKLDGKRIKSTSKGSFTLTINGKKLKSGRHRLTITATNAAGQVTTTRKTFSVCKAAKPRRKAAPRFTG